MELGTMPNIPVSRLVISSTNYLLTIGGYSGDTGYDAMAIQQRSTIHNVSDADHDSWDEWQLCRCVAAVDSGMSRCADMLS